jgi:hypothetical protein
MHGKSMYQMDENEFGEFIRRQEQTVAKLNYERPGSPTANVEAGILKDAKELLDEKHKKPQPSGGPSFGAEDIILDESHK